MTHCLSSFCFGCLQASFLFPDFFHTLICNQICFHLWLIRDIRLRLEKNDSLSKPALSTISIFSIPPPIVTLSFFLSSSKISLFFNLIFCWLLSLACKLPWVSAIVHCLFYCDSLMIDFFPSLSLASDFHCNAITSNHLHALAVSSDLFHCRTESHGVSFVSTPASH